MKIVFLSYKESMDDVIMRLLADTGLKSYTKWKEVIDCGDSGIPKMGTHIWPGFNSAMMVAAENAVAESLAAAIRQFNATSKSESIKAMIWTIDEAF